MQHRVRQVKVAIPAEEGFVAVARLAASTLANRDDVSYEHVQDVVVAVDELCSILVKAAAPGQVLEVTYELNSDKLDIRGEVLVAGGRGREDLVPWLVDRVLRAATDSYQLQLRGERVAFAMTKRFPAPRPRPGRP